MRRVKEKKRDGEIITRIYAVGEEEEKKEKEKVYSVYKNKILLSGERETYLRFYWKALEGKQAQEHVHYELWRGSTRKLGNALFTRLKRGVSEKKERETGKTNLKSRLFRKKKGWPDLSCVSIRKQVIQKKMLQLVFIERF